MEISQIATKDTTDVTIKDPRTGQPTDIVITIYGMFSAVFRQAFLEFCRRSPKASLADLDGVALAELTKGWRGCQNNGKSYSFSKANAVALYESSGVLRSQLISAILDESRFLGKA